MRSVHPRGMPLTVLAGLDVESVADVAAGLLLRSPRLALVWSDPFTAELGWVQSRVTDSDGRCTEQTVELEHGCLSCAMRESVVRAVRRLARTGRYDTILVHLHPGIEADAAVQSLDAELAGVAFVDTVVTVLHENWLDELSGDLEVEPRGIAVAPQDDRTVAMVLGADLDTASVLIVPAPVRAAAGLEEHAVLSALCPDVVRLHPGTALDVVPASVLRTGSYDEQARSLFGRRGLLDPHLRLPDVSGRVELVRWSTLGRPLHPQRLRAAIDELADGVIRSSGHLWVASRPELVVHWYSAGECLTIGPDRSWPTARRPSLVGLVGDGLNAEHVHRVLDECVLTDAEFAVGPQVWAAWDDPFPEWGRSDAERGRGAA